MQLALFLLFAFVASAFSAQYLSVEEPIEHSYFVVFKEVVTQAQKFELTNHILHMDDANEVTFEYKHTINGFAGKLTDKTVTEVLKMDEVDYVEEDGKVYAFQQSCSSYSGSGSWGLRAISNSGCGTGSQSNLRIPSTGSGVRAYIIDTGIRSTHNDFGGRVPTGSGNCYSAISGGCEDCNGHGTHVASTTGGANYGIARSATLYSVRVLDCSGSGSNSGVVAGIDWSTGHCPSSARCTINMSLGGGASSTTDNAVNRANSAGIFVAVAAGNSNANACNYSPARASGAYTVGATSQSTSSDPRASYSNYGSCLDIFAPGSSITAAWYTSNSATNTISGTSMASPHVCGVATALWGANPSWSLSTLKNAVTSYSNSNCVSNPGSGSPNRSLYTGCN